MILNAEVSSALTKVQKVSYAWACRCALMTDVWPFKRYPFPFFSSPLLDHFFKNLFYFSLIKFLLNVAHLWDFFCGGLFFCCWFCFMGVGQREVSFQINSQLLPFSRWNRKSTWKHLENKMACVVKSAVPYFRFQGFVLFCFFESACLTSRRVPINLVFLGEHKKNFSSICS